MKKRYGRVVGRAVYWIVLLTLIGLTARNNHATLGRLEAALDDATIAKLRTLAVAKQAVTALKQCRQSLALAERRR